MSKFEKRTLVLEVDAFEQSMIQKGLIALWTQMERARLSNGLTDYDSPLIKRLQDLMDYVDENRQFTPEEVNAHLGEAKAMVLDGSWYE